MPLPFGSPQKEYALFYEVDGALHFDTSGNDIAFLEARAREILEKGKAPLAMVVQIISGFSATTRIEIKTHPRFHGGAL